MARAPRNESRRRTSAPIGRQLGWFEQQQSVAVDSLLRLGSDPLGTLLAALVMGIALALPLTLFLLLQNLQGLGQDFGEAGAFSLYLEQDIGADRQRQLLAELEQREDLAAVELVTPEQALAEFDAAKRNALLTQMNEMAVADAAELYIVHDLNPRALSPKLSGFVQAQSWFQDLTPIVVAP